MVKLLGADWTSPDGLESTSTFAAILHDNTNYETFYAGKYLNRYDATAVPRGWNQWAGLKGNSKYYNYDLNVNGQIEHHGENYEEDYLTDVIGRFALKFLNNQTCEKPFFMMLGNFHILNFFKRIISLSKIFFQQVLLLHMLHLHQLLNMKIIFLI